MHHEAPCKQRTSMLQRPEPMVRVHPQVITQQVDSSSLNQPPHGNTCCKQRVLQCKRLRGNQSRALRKMRDHASPRLTEPSSQRHNAHCTQRAPVLERTEPTGMRSSHFPLRQQVPTNEIHPTRQHLLQAEGILVKGLRVKLSHTPEGACS
jgi:hypothetical protein